MMKRTKRMRQIVLRERDQRQEKSLRSRVIEFVDEGGRWEKGSCEVIAVERRRMREVVSMRFFDMSAISEVEAPQDLGRNRVVSSISTKAFEPLSRPAQTTPS